MCAASDLKHICRLCLSSNTSYTHTHTHTHTNTHTQTHLTHDTRSHLPHVTRLSSIQSVISKSLNPPPKKGHQKQRIGCRARACRNHPPPLPPLKKRGPAVGVLAGKIAVFLHEAVYRGVRTEAFWHGRCRVMQHDALRGLARVKWLCSKAVKQYRKVSMERRKHGNVTV
jgi:hypothetical protein